MEVFSFGASLVNKEKKEKKNKKLFAPYMYEILVLSEKNRKSHIFIYSRPNNILFLFILMSFLLKVGGPSKQDFKNFDSLNAVNRHPKGHRTYSKIDPKI